MSQVTDKILQMLKALTLLEAAELVSQIEETFCVNASQSANFGAPVADRSMSSARVSSEKVTFDVVLESISDEKRIGVLKSVRSLTNLGLKEAKDFCSLLPKPVKEGISKEEAETVRKELERAGGKVSVR